MLSSLACRPQLLGSCSSASNRSRAAPAPCLHQQHVSSLSQASRLQSRSSGLALGIPSSGQLHRGHASCLARALQQQHSSMDHPDEPQQQHRQGIAPPEWHPRLYGLKESKRAALEAVARLYYDEVWGHGCTDLLDELADTGVCFNDALGMEADAFSRASLKSIIQDFQASHPLLKYDLVRCLSGCRQRTQQQVQLQRHTRLPCGLAHLCAGCTWA